MAAGDDTKLDVDLPGGVPEALDELPPRVAAETELLTQHVRRVLIDAELSPGQLLDILAGLTAAVGLQAGKTPGEVGDFVQDCAAGLLELEGDPS